MGQLLALRESRGPHWDQRIFFRINAIMSLWFVGVFEVISVIESDFTEATTKDCQMVFCQCPSFRWGWCFSWDVAIGKKNKLMVRPPSLILARDFIKKFGRYVLEQTWWSHNSEKQLQRDWSESESYCGQVTCCEAREKTWCKWHRGGLNTWLPYIVMLWNDTRQDTDGTCHFWNARWKIAAGSNLAVFPGSSWRQDP